MKDLWERYSGDFNAMSDSEIEREAAASQEVVDRETAFVEAVASWKRAGKPRSGGVPDAQADIYEHAAQ